MSEILTAGYFAGLLIPTQGYDAAPAGLFIFPGPIASAETVPGPAVLFGPLLPGGIDTAERLPGSLLQAAQDLFACRIGAKVWRASAPDGTFTVIATPTGSTYTDTTPSPGATFWYKLQGWDSANASAGFTPLAAAASWTTPAQVTGLVARAGNGSMLFAWSPAAMAATYTLSWGTASGVYTHTVTGITGTNYLLTGLQNGVSVFATVTAVNPCLSGAASAEVSATPQASGGWS